MLVVELILLAAVAVIAIVYGPFHGDENGVTFAVAVILVSAMAIQYGLHRSVESAADHPDDGYDDTDHARSCRYPANSKAQEITVAKARAKKMATAVLTFAVGCGGGAAGYMFIPAVAFSLPAIIAGVALFASTSGAEPD